MASVYLAPSFQDHNIGVGDYGSEERVCNLIGDVVDTLVKYNGITVQRNDPKMDLKGVIKDSNAKKCDIHFSIHTNAGGGRGCEVYCFKQPGTVTNSEKLANLVYTALSALTPSGDRGVKDGKHLAEIRQTSATAILVEVAYHDNPLDAAWILQNIYPIGRALAQSICTYFGKTMLEPPTDGIKRTLLRVTSAKAPAMAIVKTYVQGDKLTAVDENEGYYKLNINGTEAWISKKDVEVRV